jgi:hypothetical protein
MSKIEDEEYFP